MQPPLSISDQQKLIEEIVSTRSLNRLSDRFADVLVDLWLAAGDDALMAATEHLDGKKKFTAADFAIMIEAARQVLSVFFGASISPIVREVSIETYTRGLRSIRAGLSKSFTLTDQRAIEFIHQHHMFWSLGHFDNHVTDRLKRLSEVAIKNGLSRADAGRFFNNTIGAEMKRSRAYWQLTADAITTRARSFSTISALEQLGIETYRISIVDDHRTSDICRYLDGQEVTIKNSDGTESKHKLEDAVFSVSDAVELRDAMLDATSPEEAKKIMPWLKPETVVGKSISGLASSGVLMPPFHGNCRSKLVIDR